MTADERIEKLLNRFGQTISDLPKPSRVEWAYSSEQIKKALNAATEWSAIPFISGNSTGDYICHLVDIIDRMKTTLQTASDQIDDIRETASCMAENCRPWEDQRDAGFDEACMEIVKLIDGYSVYEKEET